MLRRSLALLVVVVLCSGCTRLRLTRECRQFSRIVETGRHQIEQATAPRTPAAYRASVPLYRQVAGHLRQAAGPSELRRSAEDYARAVEAIGANVSAYADALASGDAEREASAGRALETASRRERIASRRLEDQCHGRIQVF